MPDKEREPHRATQRVLQILQLVSGQERRGYTLSEIAGELQTPKSSLFPIVHTMREAGFLAYDADTMRYAVGYKAYEVGSRYAKSRQVTVQVRRQMEQVVASCSETCHLGELQGGDVFYLLKVDSPQPIRMHSQAGRRLPAYGTGLGKALLCEKSLLELQELYPNGLTALTPNTKTDISALFEELQEVRRTGVAYETEESNLDIRCIAVPVREAGRITKALSVAVPVFRYSGQMEARVISLLQSAALAMEELLRDPLL